MTLPWWQHHKHCRAYYYYYYYYTIQTRSWTCVCVCVRVETSALSISAVSGVDLRQSTQEVRLPQVWPQRRSARRQYNHTPVCLTSSVILVHFSSVFIQFYAADFVATWCYDWAYQLEKLINFWRWSCLGYWCRITSLTIAELRGF